MGDFDYVPRSLEAAGVKRRFHGLAMRPGKPTFYGLSGTKAAFGLPGNPVSTFVNFEILVKPHLYRRMGLLYSPRLFTGRLASDIRRKAADRVEFLPARSELGAKGESLVRPITYHGSSMLSVLAEADCLLRLELGEERIEEGRMVSARLIRP
jgi:molybdopterin molybdotransferase